MKKEIQSNILPFADVDVNTFIKLTRLNCIGHLLGKDNVEITKKVLNAPFNGKRKRGRTRPRWLDVVQINVKVSEMRTWRMAALERRK